MNKNIINSYLKYLLDTKLLDSWKLEIDFLIFVWII